MRFDYLVEGGNFSAAGYPSSQIKMTLKQLNVDGKVIKRTVVALYEADVNIVSYACRGVISVDIHTKKITIHLADEGPVVAGIFKILREKKSNKIEIMN